ncbi:hypothetical protein LTS08_002619 [Lithohypha guttulata]|uniref:ATP synthase mitochondrial F1 complex assembly factor 1 n=1 Tax=Lithohypha guttulata TaxID=1690604 RepID=A0AAN7TC80_9EURO|nr:hypothetical protein LTR05_000651 [Lithohypha guttulata]KAK5104727.1 hypothetical protein LTS08_002619 [Lithohypha guttulata]
MRRTYEYYRRHDICTTQVQRRWAQVHDIRFVATRHNSTSIHNKYQDKLEEKARAEGFESVEQLKAAYEDRIKKLRKRVGQELDKVTNPDAQIAAQQSQGHSQSQKPFHPPPPPQAQTSSQPTKSPSAKHDSGAPGIKPLSSYLDLDKVASLPNKEIEYLWRLRHASDPKSLCAVIPLEVYKRIYETAKTHPRFILPLPRPAADDGSGDIKQSADGFSDSNEPRAASDIHFLQWSFHPPAGPPPAPGSQTANTHTSTILFTHLAAFKLHGEYAQPHTTVTHHLDLADSHGLVLLNGSVVDSRGVSAEEAKWLLLCMQKFYDHGGHGGGIGKEKRQNLLKKFSQGDASFDVNELVDEAERIS